MHRAALIDQIQQAREPLEKLLTLLQSTPVERDRFVSHLYQARREYRRTCETAGKSGKQIERCVISKFQVAGSRASKGGLRQWEEFLRIGDREPEGLQRRALNAQRSEERSRVFEIDSWRILRKE